MFATDLQKVAGKTFEVASIFFFTLPNRPAYILIIYLNCLHFCLFEFCVSRSGGCSNSMGEWRKHAERWGGLASTGSAHDLVDRKSTTETLVSWMSRSLWSKSSGGKRFVLCLKNSCQLFQDLSSLLLDNILNVWKWYPCGKHISSPVRIY